MASSESYLVVGGCGNLGRHIVDRLIGRGETKVSVFDIVQRHFDSNITFYTGDISNPEDVTNAIVKSGATAVFHTASPVYDSPSEILERINVTGTSNIVDACQAHGVKKLVYTSSGGVVLSQGTALISVDERLDYPEVPLDAYNTTKIAAEKLVLAANGEEGLLTCSIRPAGIFGPGDTHIIQAFHQAIDNNQTKFQIGDNLNLNDFTHIDNVAHAHMLAMDKLDSSYPYTAFRDPIPSIDVSLGKRRIPTSDAHPLGPNESPSESDQLAAKKFESGEIDPNDLRPVLRNRMDHFSTEANDDDENGKIPIAGQAYFITNGEPVYAWDFIRNVWRQFGDTPSYVYVLPAFLAMFISTIMELVSKITGKTPGFTKYRVSQVVQNRFFDIEKARRLLGYEPVVGIDAGVREWTDWYKTELAKRSGEENRKTR